LMESEVDVGVRLIQQLRLVGRYVHGFEGEQADEHLVGLGVSYTF